MPWYTLVQPLTHIIILLGTGLTGFSHHNTMLTVNHEEMTSSISLEPYIQYNRLCLLEWADLQRAQG